jgi:hypothetical protein
VSDHRARLAKELLATADAVRSMRAALAKMIDSGDALPCWPDVSVVMTDGLSVAIALERLAQKIAVGAN